MRRTEITRTVANIIACGYRFICDMYSIMSLALYRKYRPKSFTELVGQDYCAAIFRNAGKQSRLGHAYIFYGSRGTGKTTTARLVAKLANCLSVDAVREHGEPCNACRACAEIDAARAMDVIEIDAASNRGIDEIRHLQEAIRLSPSLSARKVFIIDEAHMLTTYAWNALLKTLEEPPPHVILILATTEYEKIPATIVSRAQRFHFRKIGIMEIVKKLRHIAAAEKLTISDDILELIAAGAEGSLRDAESLLDQVVSCADTIDVRSVEDILGKVGSRRVRDCVACIVSGDLSGALTNLCEARNIGVNVVDLTKELIAYLRRALALRLDPKLETLFRDELTTDDLAQIIAYSKTIDSQKTIALLKSLIRAYSEMRYSPFPHIPLEVAFIENLRK